MVLGGGLFLMSEVTLYSQVGEGGDHNHGCCEDRVLEGPASGKKGSKGGPYKYCNPRT